MAIYQLKTSGGSVLVAVQASSNLDGSRRETRRGQVTPTLSSTVVQYMEATVVGDQRIEWRIPYADGTQRAFLQSASNGIYGDELTLTSPKYGDILVAFVPGVEAYEETPLMPDNGYEILCRLVRL